MPQPKLTQAMPRFELILLRRFPRPHQIPQRLERCVRHPRRQKWFRYTFLEGSFIVYHMQVISSNSNFVPGIVVISCQA